MPFRIDVPALPFTRALRRAFTRGALLMTLLAIGAGLGRTGTNSLKAAIEHLTGGRCYHTHEVLLNLDHVQRWQFAFENGDADWDAMFDGYVATVDWPGCRFWEQLADRYPNAPVILSARHSGEAWWASAEPTVFASMKRGPLPGLEDWYQMMRVAMVPFTDHLDDRETAIAAYERHNDSVRQYAGSGRLVEWNPALGWEPLCEALDIAVPNDPFPHLNTTKDFRELAALDDF
jgi:hypothetical protein